MNEPWWIDAVKAFIIINLLLLTFAYMTWVERKVIGRMQRRYGPNRAGPFGLLITLADGIKLFFKEGITPEAVDRAVFLVAPVIALLPAFLAFAVVPFGTGVTLFVAPGPEVTSDTPTLPVTRE